MKNKHGVTTPVKPLYTSTNVDRKAQAERLKRKHKIAFQLLARR